MKRIPVWAWIVAVCIIMLLATTPARKRAWREAREKQHREYVEKMQQYEEWQRESDAREPERERLRQEHEARQQRIAEREANRPPPVRFTMRDYERLSGRESTVEFFLRVEGVESARSGDFKTVTYIDDFGAIISVGYRRRDDREQDEREKDRWEVVSKSQIGL